MWRSKEEKLRRASKSGDVETVQSLLAKGDVAVDAIDDARCWLDGNSALLYAAQEGFLPIVEALLAAHASVNSDGRTPLHEAAARRHAPIVKALLEAGANPNATAKRNATPLHVTGDSPEIVDLLLKAKADPNAVLEDGDSPLITASSWGRTEVVRLLLAAGATPNVANKHKFTPLHKAAMGGHNAVVYLLLAAGASPNATAYDGRTPLHCADEVQVVQPLLKAKADPNAVNEAGWTPLHTACSNRLSLVVSELLRAGANLHAKNNAGYEPLHLCILKHVELNQLTLYTIQALVSFGATWDAECDAVIAAGVARDEVLALRLCVGQWVQDVANDRPMVNVPIGIVLAGPGNGVALAHALGWAKPKTPVTAEPKSAT